MYHVTNKCYKGYTLKKTLESISEQSSHIETQDSTLNEKEEPAKKRLRWVIDCVLLHIKINI